MQGLTPAARYHTLDDAHRGELRQALVRECKLLAGLPGHPSYPGSREMMDAHHRRADAIAEASRRGCLAPSDVFTCTTTLAVPRLRVARDHFKPNVLSHLLSPPSAFGPSGLGSKRYATETVTAIIHAGDGSADWRISWTSLPRRHPRHGDDVCLLVGLDAGAAAAISLPPRMHVVTKSSTRRRTIRRRSMNEAAHAGLAP